jgi:hypothetical protein
VYSQNEILAKRLIIEGIMAIQSGDNLEILISEKQEMVLRLVREAVQAHAAENKQKAKVEEIADKVERGELSIVALLALLSSGVRNEIMQQIKICRRR